MDLGLRLIEVYAVFNRGITFQQDIDNILLTNFTIVTYLDNGRMSDIYSFDVAARFDTGNIYQQIKHVYSSNENYLPILFPSKEILRSFNEEYSSKVERVCNKSSKNTHPPHPKMILLELFNGFKTNKKINYYYYTRPTLS
ncbi:virion protein [Cheloniid poxvirus 1]|nr:virion protein [Cheloniid poxvirus 1]